MIETHLSQTKLMEMLEQNGFPCSHKTIIKWEEAGMPVALPKTDILRKRYLWSEVYEWLTSRKNSE